MNFKHIGKDVQYRPDVLERVTGEAIFIDDIKLPGMLYAQILRPKYAHAKILSIDTLEAEKMPGVYKVIMGKGWEKHYGDCIKDMMPMAVDKVRHIGDAVAAVVADTEKDARDALKKIRVEYEPLPVYTDAMEAIKEDACLIHENSDEYFHVSPLYEPIPKTNIALRYRIKKGDAVKGFKEADIVVEREFNFPLMSSAAIEVHGAIALFRMDNTIEIWTSNVGSFAVREEVANLFDLPISDVRVHVPYIGGCFGYKSDPSLGPLIAYIASFVPGHPIKLRVSRQEDFTSTFIGRGIRTKMKIGAKKDGTFTAMEAKLYLSTGAYADTGSNVLIVATQSAGGVYEFSNADVTGYSVYTNTPPVGALRAYGHPEIQFALERLVDIVARELDMSPDDVRRKNFLSEGKSNVVGETMKKSDGDLYKCIDNVERAIFSKEKPKEDENYYYGRGIAGLIKSPKAPTFAAKGCHIKFNVDGSISVNMSGADVGQGLFILVRQIAAEALKLPLEKVRVYNEIDTQFSPWEWQTVGSMFTFQGGNAIIKAANKAIEMLKKNAALVLHRDVSVLEYDGNYVYDISYPDVKVPVSKICRGYIMKDGTTIGDVVQVSSDFRLPGAQNPDPETGMGRTGVSYTMGVQGCELRIEKKTGKVIIDNFATSIDIGRVINPSNARGQVVGGVVMGIGETLMEEIKFDKNGKLINANLLQYKLPTIYDMPGKQTIEFVETHDEIGPFGARGIGEHPMVGVAPAILNAIYDAIGYDFYEIPLTPDKIKAVIGADMEVL